MNIRAQPIIDDRVTRLFSVADVRAMFENGILHPDERVELVEGVLVRGTPRNRSHELIKNWLMRHAIDGRGDDWRISVAGTFYLDEHTFIEPDILFHQPGTVITDLKGPDALLAVEVADTTLRYDLGRKAQIYAQYGVRELWVIDTNRRETHVHLRPSIDGYGTVDVFDDAFEVRPRAVPRFTMRLKDAR